MFDRPQRGQRAVLVHLDVRSVGGPEDLEEFRQLAESAGVWPAAVVRGVRDRPDAKYFIGAGKVEEVCAAARGAGAELVLFNHGLSPVQERNLEQALQCRVVDRTGLILDIFAQRARTFEGKLQVELAQLRHLATRLVRGWSHLERQKGGIGLRGPGETQLETDRRLIGRRIKLLNTRLDKVCRQRQLRRRARCKAAASTVSLVGYTNAGKSTLFNRLTGASVYAADQLFATLDPTLRRLHLPGVGGVILADTVGFIRDLPTDLVAAFRATLEETVEAGLLLHVVDAHEAAHNEHKARVNEVLEGIAADGIPQIEVYNKIDLLDGVAPRIDRDASGRPKRVWLSAHSGAGLELLEQAIAESLQDARAVAQGVSDAARPAHTRPVLVRIRLQPGAAQVRAKLFAWGVVQREAVNEQGEWVLDALVYADMVEFLEQQNGCCLEVGGKAPPEPKTCGDGAGILKSATISH